MEVADLSPRYMIPGIAAAIIVWTLHVVVPVALGVIALVRSIRASRQARAADAVALEDTPLAPGPACIHGPVEYAPGEKNAVIVAIRQVGTNHQGKNNNWSHSWTESQRTVTASPFYVRDDRGGAAKGGTRIRVEPDDKTLLIDKLDRKVRHSEALRERFAEIADGEVVYVVGELVSGRDPGAGGYREAETALVMRAPATSGGGRLLVSSEPLGERFRRDASSLRNFVTLFVLFIVVFALIDIPYHARVLWGRVERARVVEVIPHGGKSSYCELEVEILSNKARVNVDTDMGWCSTFNTKPEPSYLPVYVVSQSSFAHVGVDPAVHVGSTFGAVLVLALSIIAYHLRTRAWYESKVTDSGSGKLSEARD